MGGSSSKKVSPELVNAADTDKDGFLSVEELGDMLRKAGEDWPDKRIEKLLGALDENGDGLVDLAEFKKGAEQLLAVVGALHSMGVEQQPATVQTGPAKSPPPSFAALIAAGTVVPDERDGPYALGSYHANVTGLIRGYKSLEGHREWEATNSAIMALQTSWATIDFEAENAVDPEFMFNHGLINGGGLSMQELRPTVIKAQAAMKTGYGGAFESAHRQAGRRRGVRADRSTAREDRQGAAAGRRAARPPRAVQGRARRGRRAVGVWAAGDRRERRGGRGRVVGPEEGVAPRPALLFLP